MPHSTFFRFMGPSLLAMLLFIALPIVSIDAMTASAASKVELALDRLGLKSA